MLTRVLFAVALILGLAGAVSAEEVNVEALGVTDHAVTQEELQKGTALATPRFDSAGVAHGLVADLKKGDTVKVSFLRNGHSLMHNERELDGDEDFVLLQAGKVGVPAGGWPKGDYSAKVTVTRDGKEVLSQESEAMTFK